MKPQRILVTGSAGTIGKLAVGALRARGHHVRGFDRVPTPAASEQVVGQLTDGAAVHAACAGMDAVIHLAATPDSADFVSDLVPNNLVGPYHVLEAVRAAKVGRLVVASTIRVGFMHDWYHNVVRVGDGFAPHDHYSFTKAAGEVMGEMYARLHGLTVLCARIGWVVRNADEVAAQRRNAWHSGILLSQDDCARYVVACVENPLHFPTATRFAAMFVTSRPMETAAVDLSEATAVTGWAPENTWPEGTPWVAEHARLLGQGTI
jgi:nucleoside-diphosphate-sugar epimerase